MEHWLPLFYEKLETVFDYLKGFRLVTDHTVREAAEERSKLVFDYYDARLNSGQAAKGQMAQGTPYKPVTPGQLYLDGGTFARRRSMPSTPSAFRLSMSMRARAAAWLVVDARQGPRWARSSRPMAADNERVNVFDAVVKHIADRRAAGGEGLDHQPGRKARSIVCYRFWPNTGLPGSRRLTAFKDLSTLAKGEAAAAVLSLEAGFETGDLIVIGEQDILGDRMVRRSKRRRKRAADFISEVAGLDEGSIVVHAEHGIGRFVGLRTIEAAGAPHACLELQYADDAKLFLPVENIDLLSRLRR